MRDELARHAVAEKGVAPAKDRLLTEDPEHMRVAGAVMYVLRIRTNRWLIAASAMGYFFLSGLRTFGLVFVRGHFGLGQTGATLILFLAGLGSLAGVLVAGRLADRLIRNGRLDGRVLVPGICFIVAAATLLPSLLLTVMWVAIPMLVVSGAMLSAPNPPLDAARLDIMLSQLWGRAEGVRTLIRQSAQAGAPLLFGALADVLGGGSGALGSAGHVSAASTSGLRWAFLIMLVPLALNGVALLVARRSYATDVATAMHTERRGRRRAPTTSGKPGDDGHENRRRSSPESRATNRATRASVRARMTRAHGGE